MSAARLRRSVLFVPGSNARALDKARTLNADAVIIDLEDAVAPDAKADARAAARDAVAAGFAAGHVVVRVNGLHTDEGLLDLEAIAPSGANAILIPKVDAADEIDRLCAVLDAARAPRGLALWAMIETARGIMNVAEIAERGARRRLSALVVGANDLCQDLECTPGVDRAHLTPALMSVVTAARAFGLTALDSVYNAHTDTDGFAREARQARDMGFHGKTLIHPSQIEPAHAAFAPSPDEVAWARKVVAAFQVPENLARGAITVDGKMVERLHMDVAMRILARHDAQGARGGDDASSERDQDEVQGKASSSAA